MMLCVIYDILYSKLFPWLLQSDMGSGRVQRGCLLKLLIARPSQYSQTAWTTPHMNKIERYGCCQIKLTGRQLYIHLNLCDGPANRDCKRLCRYVQTAA